MRHDRIDPGSSAAPEDAAFSRPDENAVTPFRDRIEAGRMLADRLRPILSPPAVVAAIPRGGVAVALPIVERLGFPLAVVYARKLTAAIAPELAFGALDEDGEVIIDAETVAALGLRPVDVDQAMVRVAAEIKRRMALYRVPPLAHFLPGAHVVLVDDGLATGLSMRAALAYARRHGASQITMAVPCASTQAAERFRREVDHFVSLVVDHMFMAVGAYYVDFSAVSDDAVRTMLERARQPAPAGGSPRSGLRISFKSSRGHRLAGELLLPEGAGPHPVVAFAHGWDSSKASPPNRAVAAALCAAGIAAFLFDFTGHGDSEGSKEESTLAQQVDDLRAALDVLQTLDEIDARRLGVAAASSGTAAALRLAAADARIRVLALGSANPAGAEAAAALIRVPTLLVMGERDPIIDIAGELLPRLAGPRRLEVIPGGDHLFEAPGTLAKATAVMVGWLRDHLG